MTVSVIIPTYNGARKIIHTLRALEKQTFQDFDTIVVVDGSTDDTMEILKKTRFQLKSMTIVFQENKGRASVRNNGAKKAKGDLLVFFDDDMRPVEDCLAAHLQHHQQYEQVIAVGTQLNNWKEATTEMQRYRCYYSHKWEKNLRVGGNQPSVMDHKQLYITAANFSVRKNTFLLLNGFDERLNDAEDYDLAVRAYENNIAVFYLPTAHAWHDENYSLASYIRRRKGYIEALQRLNQLKPELYQKHTQRKIEKKQGVKKVIFWFFSFPFLVKSVDKLNFFGWMPSSWKFKLYDLIITSSVVYFPGKS